MGETGVLKKRTELTMTTTRFIQFPTECVTGDTLLGSKLSATIHSTISHMGVQLVLMFTSVSHLQIIVSMAMLWTISKVEDT
jgi:hypothetical protein